MICINNDMVIRKLFRGILLLSSYLSYRIRIVRN